MNGQTYLGFLAALLRLLCALAAGDGFAPSVGHDRLVTEILLSSHWHLDSCHVGSSLLMSLWASLVSPHHNVTGLSLASDIRSGLNTEHN